MQTVGCYMCVCMASKLIKLVFLCALDYCGIVASQDAIEYNDIYIII
jgi:hypothetical protein